jgi:ATP-dependent DNA ligase
MPTFPFNQPFDRQKYVDISSEDSVAQWDIIQPKYDGIWARLQKEQGHAQVYSRTSQVKTTLDLPKLAPNTVLLGEYMYGSQWALQEERVGKLFIFDCISFYGKDVRSEAYKERLRMSRQIVEETGFPLVSIKSYPINYYPRVWSVIEEQREFEGVVFRKWDDPYNSTVGRRKLDITDDYVVIDVIEGKGKHVGRMGALVVGQYIEGELKALFSVGGGFDDWTRQLFWERRSKLIGQVVEVVGKARFASGALRHPNFVRLRPDKLATECIGQIQIFND